MPSFLQGFSDPESIKKVVDSMKAAGASVELFMYDGSGHAFMNALTEKGRAKIKGVLLAQHVRVILHCPCHMAL